MTYTKKQPKKTLLEIRHAVIYCRVSTKEQAEEGTSLITQERLCKEYASRNNYLVVRVFIEFGESAKTADRTELHNLFKYCASRSNVVDSVIVYKLDRLSRNTDDYSYIRLLLRQYKVNIRSTSENFEDTPAGRFMENIIATVAQFDNDMRAERSMGGMREAARSGRYVWVAPIGYKNRKINGKSTIVQDSQAQLVRQSFEMMATEQYTIAEVFKAMAQNGMHSKAGKQICKSSFYRIFHNETYTGQIVKFGERYKGSFKPIVSEELYYKVQALIFKKDPHKNVPVPNRNFPLSKIVAMENGWCLFGYSKTKKNGKTYSYYSFKAKGTCVRKDTMEEAFAAYLDTFALSRRRFTALRDHMERRCALDELQRTSEQSKIETSIQELKERRNYLLEQGYRQVLSKRALEEEILRIQEELRAHSEKLLSPEAERHALALVDEARAFLVRPSVIWNSLQYEDKVKLQQLLFPRKLLLINKTFTPKATCALFRLGNGEEESYQLVTDCINELQKLSTIRNLGATQE